jgi:hypothetical protein
LAFAHHKWFNLTKFGLSWLNYTSLDLSTLDLKGKEGLATDIKTQIIATIL